MKTCFRCHREKPEEEFYRHPAMGDGRLGKCKDCTRSDVNQNRNKRLDEIREYDRVRSKSSTRIAGIVRTVRKWRNKNSRKYAAHILVNNAIRSGKLKPQPCIKCGAKAHAHHENYDKPLDVVWLCAIHHSERHKEMKKEGIEP